MAGSDPFSSSSDVDIAVPSSLIIDLHDVNSIESLPMRTLTIGSPWTLKIGRGSQTETDLHPHVDNAWFSSRVMSREHALIKADPNTRRITLQDLGSMHGTYIEGRRLDTGEAAELIQDDVVTFGANIVRGDLTYEALSLKLHFGWSTELHSPRPANDRFRNTFTADYNEDDRVSDDDVQIIEQMAHHNRSQPGRKSRTFSVPDSDESDADSDIEVMGDSEPSSLVDDNDTWKPEDDSSRQQVDDRAASVIEIPTIPQVAVTDTLPQPYIGREEADEASDDAAEFNQENRASTKIINPAENLTDDDSDFEVESEVESDMDDFSDTGDRPAVTQHDRDEALDETIQKEPATSANAALPRMFSFPPVACRLPYVPSYGYYEQQPVQTLPPQPIQTQDPKNDAWRSSLSYCPYDYQYYSNPLPRMQTHPTAQVPWDNGCELSSGSLARPSFGLMDTAPAFNHSKETWNTRPKDFDGSNATNMPKVSINDILEPPRPDDSSLASESTRKRKADEISGVEEAEAEDVVSQEQDFTAALAAVDGVETEVVAEDPTLDAAQLEETLEVVPESETTTSSAVQTIEVVEERPSKRVKLDGTAAAPPSRSKTVLKYTATAVAGVAIGAVSTIFGLAALPAGFFE